MTDAEQSLLAGYRRLHDTLVEMVEGGRLTIAEIPDDYGWLIAKLHELAVLEGIVKEDAR